MRETNLHGHLVAKYGGKKLRKARLVAKGGRVYYCKQLEETAAAKTTHLISFVQDVDLYFLLCFDEGRSKPFWRK